MVFPDYLVLLRKITEGMKLVPMIAPPCLAYVEAGKGGERTRTCKVFSPWLARFGHGTLQCPWPTRLGKPGELDGEG